MKSTIVFEHTIRLSNGETIVAAPYEQFDVGDVHLALRWFNSLRGSWMEPLTAFTVSVRPSAWMR